MRGSKSKVGFLMEGKALCLTPIGYTAMCPGKGTACLQFTSHHLLGDSCPRGTEPFLNVWASVIKCISMCCIDGLTTSHILGVPWIMSPYVGNPQLLASVVACSACPSSPSIMWRAGIEKA